MSLTDARDDIVGDGQEWDDLRALWAKSKPFHPLWCHLLDVAAVSRELLDYFGPVTGLASEWASALAGLHDIGKADVRFQQKAPGLACIGRLVEAVPESDVRGFRHELRSASVIRQFLADSGWPAPEARVAARALLGHHGAFPVEVGTEDGDREVRWRPARRALAALVVEQTGARGVPLPFSHRDVTGVQLLGLTISADWIASNDTLFARPAATLSPTEYTAAARLSARAAMNALGFRRSPIGMRATWEENWPGRTPRGIQPEAIVIAGEITEPALVILEAPMGEGKTEAALHLASAMMSRLGKAGFYVALPTQATSNQMHGRVREFLARRYADAEPLLVHGMAWLMDGPALRDPGALELDSGSAGDDEAAAARAWLRNSRRALLAPFAVGTVDQLLLAALAVKFGVLRLLGLSNKVVIVDEVHACDAYMMRRLECALAWLRVLRVPVILLSATLARGQRAALVRAYAGEECGVADSEGGYPLLTVAPAGRRAISRAVSASERRGGAFRSLEVELVRGLLDDPTGHRTLAAQVIEAVQDGGCAVVVMNTVTAAQRVFAALRAELTARRPAADAPWTTLFHARFPAWRRIELEREVLDRFGPPEAGSRPMRGVVVATQVVEQSLDLDFDVMFTELAPIDLLLQRSGRLWRHERGGRPVPAPRIRVLVPAAGQWDFGASQRIYARLHLLRTLGLLDQRVVNDRASLEIPREIPELVEAVHGGGAAAFPSIPHELLAEAANELSAALGSDRAHANSHLVGAPTAGEFRYPNQRAVMLEPEDDAAGANALYATTRLERLPSRAILALTREGDGALLEAAARTGHPIVPDTLRALLETRVSVPEYMLEDIPLGTPVVRGATVVDLRKGAVGRLGYDESLGITRLAGERERG